MSACSQSRKVLGVRKLACALATFLRQQQALPLTRISTFADILLSPFQGSFFLTLVQGFRFASPLAILCRASGANLHDRRYLRNLA
jgi:hypothetical protein